jgi:hypothetical protein
MGEAPILIAKITINTYENNNTTLIFESDNGQNINLNLVLRYGYFLHIMELRLIG